MESIVGITDKIARVFGVHDSFILFTG